MNLAALSEASETDTINYVEHFQSVCQRATEAGLASERLFSVWIQMFNGLGKWAEARDIAELMTAHHEQSATAWLARIGLLYEHKFIGHYRAQQLVNTVNGLFSSALESVDKSDAFPIWTAFFEFNCLHQSIDKLTTDAVVCQLLAPHRSVKAH
jgi:hypothetical protein